MNGLFDVDDDEPCSEPCSIADDNGTDDNGRGEDIVSPPSNFSRWHFKGTFKKLYNADQADQATFIVYLVYKCRIGWSTT